MRKEKKNSSQITNRYDADCDCDDDHHHRSHCFATKNNDNLPIDFFGWLTMKSKLMCDKFFSLFSISHYYLKMCTISDFSDFFSM